MAENQASNMVIVVKKNGERYETPIDNLDQVRRLVPYKELIFPGMEDEMELREEIQENGPEIIAPKKRGPKPKQTN